MNNLHLLNSLVVPASELDGMFKEFVRNFAAKVKCSELFLLGYLFSTVEQDYVIFIVLGFSWISPLQNFFNFTRFNKAKVVGIKLKDL